ncbi:hypothetical protein [Microbispora hainanensis]|uniref:hypothetical protein n=1 Tax=Microbispora hainanensis TaxID=568844 RepID=UPI001ABEFDB7|nr:hypothetical protein [Microbispora hainanensis]
MRTAMRRASASRSGETSTPRSRLTRISWIREWAWKYRFHGTVSSTMSQSRHSAPKPSETTTGSGTSTT